MKRLLLLLVSVTTLMTAAMVAVKFGAERPLTEVGPKQSPVRPPVVRPEATHDEAVASVKLEDLKRDVYYLASDRLEGRMSGKEGNRLAADYVEGEFRKAGLKTMRHRFRMSRYNPGPKGESGDDFSENVYGWLEGTDPHLKNEVLVVGAHMDHIGYGPTGSSAPSRREVHPGADDNASGTAAVLAVSRAFASRKNSLKRTAVFMAFSGEEMGLVGSRFYCENPVFPQSGPSMGKHVAMINMDMIGYLKGGRVAAKFVETGNSPDLQREIDTLAAKYPFAKGVTGRGSGGSDHAPFHNKGVPVACLHTGMHGKYHTPEDRPESINYEGLERVARYAFELSWRTSESVSRPVFDVDNFRAMDYSHDHGEEGKLFPSGKD